VKIQKTELNVITNWLIVFNLIAKSCDSKVGLSVTFFSIINWLDTSLIVSKVKFNLVYKLI